MPESGAMSFEEVRRLLPQRHPLLMVDKVLALAPGESVRAVKNVTGNEAFFQGHFPAIAIMPAALVLEGLAQATILLVRSSATGAPPADDEVYVFGSVHAKMLKPVLPGDVLTYDVKLVRLFGNGGAADGVASVDGQPAVQAEMYFSKLKASDLARKP